MASHGLLPIRPPIPLPSTPQPVSPASLPPDGDTPASRPEIVISGVEPLRLAPGPGPGRGFEPANSIPGNSTLDRKSAPAALRPSRPKPPTRMACSRPQPAGAQTLGP